MPRKRPNILITGTPGTGKTTTCELLASASGLKHVNIGELVKKEELHCGWDDEYACFVIDEDKVMYDFELLRWLHINTHVCSTRFSSGPYVAQPFYFHAIYSGVRCIGGRPCGWRYNS